ncbi:hypothetical protein BGX38DRAFT_496209 [Terfezia claveryi]|nr:hypothetical protein BGX38DRAFT_496209 [Terfezia claveryi]
MPLDFVHVKGVFESNESCGTPPHGSPPSSTPLTAFSFALPLVSEKPPELTTSGAQNTSPPGRHSNPPPPLRSSLTSSRQSDPVRILDAVMRGFDIANPETVGAEYVANAGEDKSTNLRRRMGGV